MTDSAVCPSCLSPQMQGILCWQCCEALLTMFQAIPTLVDELQTAIGKQARVGSTGPGGLARERAPINFGALAVRDALLVELALWGDDVDEIRRHPKAAEIVSGVGKAVKNGYRAIDRMQDRQYLGRCGMYDEGREQERCQAELWATPKAAKVRCPKCKHAHEVATRRVELLAMAEDLLCTVKEASRYMGEVGHVVVTEASIRGYIHRKRVLYRNGTMIRLGDLMAVVLDESERKSA